MINKGAKALVPDLASDGLPFFAEPVFLFGWALRNTSIYYMLTCWLSCLNNALHGKFLSLHILLQYIFTYALFWLPGVNLSLKNQLPYYTISFSWNKSKQMFAGTIKVLMRWMFRSPFFAKVTILFLKGKRIFLLSLELNLLQDSALFKRAFEKYKPRGLFSEFYGINLLKLLLLVQMCNSTCIFNS